MSIGTKFLGFQNQNHLKWKNATGDMIPKLYGAYCVVRSLFRISNRISEQFTLSILTLMKCGTMFEQLISH
jgi:hypothetical protein